MTLILRNALEQDFLTFGGVDIGTVSVQILQDRIQFGEFYILPEYQNKGIGSQILAHFSKLSNQLRLPVVLEYLKWNPVANLYHRFGFYVTHETEYHYYLKLDPQLL